MWKHCKFKIEEVLGIRILVLVWLVNLLPNVFNIRINNSPNSLEVISSVIKISQDKEKLLSRLLSEELQVDFEYDFQESIV